MKLKGSKLMISCEQFETLYPFVETSEVTRHRKSCPHCVIFTEEIAILKRSILSLPKHCVSNDFETRLQNRLTLAGSEATFGMNLAPRALAFASGLAVILIAGAIYNGVETTPVSKMAGKPGLEKVSWAEAESDSLSQDSTDVLTSSPWGDFSRIEAVSSQQ